MSDDAIRGLSDRLEIEELVRRYAWAIDTDDYELLDTCFLPDAHLDYVSSGGEKGAYPEVRAWLEQVLSTFVYKQHFVSNHRATIDGDRAEATTYVYNPNAMRNPDGSLLRFTVGAWYRDELVRTDEGWRIAKRVEETVFAEGIELPGAAS